MLAAPRGDRKQSNKDRCGWMAGAGSQTPQSGCMVSAAQSTRQLSHRGTPERHLKSLTDSCSSNNKSYESHYNARITMSQCEVPLHYTSVSLWGVNRTAEHIHTRLSICRRGGSVMKENICKAACHADVPLVWIGNIVDLLDYTYDPRGSCESWSWARLPVL